MSPEMVPVYFLGLLVVVEYVFFQIAMYQRNKARALLRDAEKVLREIYLATCDGNPLDEIGWRLKRRPAILWLLERIAGANGRKAE